MSTFAGPADVGVFSPSVQMTLYEMGRSALQVQPAIDRITLYMPNLHFIPFPLEKLGLTNKDHSGLPDIFFPIDEPHGMIKVWCSWVLLCCIIYYYLRCLQATLERSVKSKL